MKGRLTSSNIIPFMLELKAKLDSVAVPKKNRYLLMPGWMCWKLEMGDRRKKKLLLAARRAGRYRKYGQANTRWRCCK